MQRDPPPKMNWSFSSVECALFFGPAQLHSDLNLWPLPAYKESLLQNSGSADCPIQKMFLRQLFKPKT